MSTLGARWRNGRIGRLVLGTRTEQTDPGTVPAVADTPYWLLWSTGILAFVLAIAAFVLWGINGASTLFDMIVALCT